MKLIPVESSMLTAVGFDKKSGELEAVFTTGAVWRYENVPENVYRELLAAGSVGGYMRDCIIGVYPDYQIRRR